MQFLYLHFKLPTINLVVLNFGRVYVYDKHWDPRIHLSMTWFRVYVTVEQNLFNASHIFYNYTYSYFLHRKSITSKFFTQYINMDSIFSVILELQIQFT